MKQSKMEPVVEEIGEDARLLWIGQRQSKCVLLYFHGEFGEASSFHVSYSLSDSAKVVCFSSAQLVLPQPFGI